MPIRPENRDLYPRHWKALSFCLRADRAKWRCEWCGAKNSDPHPITGGKVVLTVAHLDHQPNHCQPDNLAALCQLCHNRYDQDERRKNRKMRLDKANGVRELFEK